MRTLHSLRRSWAAALGVLLLLSLGTGSAAAGAAGAAPAVPAVTPLALGVTVPPGTDPPGAALGRFSSALGRPLALAQDYTPWRSAAGAFQPFPTDFARHALALGTTPLVTWEPRTAGAGPDQPAFTLAALASGRYDSYIRAWADAARALDHQVYVRVMEEMNLPAFPWSIGVQGNTAPQFVAAWDHIVALFAAEGAADVQFIWCPSASGADPDPEYPGDSRVSWLGMDGYNRGTPWRSVAQIFTPLYDEITAHSARPVMVAETASVELPGNPGAKASWITDGFLSEIPVLFPSVRAVLWFDGPGTPGTYPVTSSPAAWAAFSAVARSPLYAAPAPAA
jgi:hypothetical protein